MVRIAFSCVVGVMLTLVVVAAQQATAARVVAPASYVSGPMPALPVLALGGGEVVVELTVSDRGAVVAVKPLRATASFTESVLNAVKAWQFTPAEELIDPAARKPGEPAIRAIESKVTVAGLFRPPSFYAGTLGEPIRDVAPASNDAPFPIATIMPSLQPSVRNSGVVLIEARVDGNGTVVETTVKSSAPPFDEPALDAARQWKFRPARISGAPATARVYLVFSFQLPVALSAPASPPVPPPPASR